MELATVINPFSTVFEWKFDGRLYTIPANGSLDTSREIAAHLAFHIAQKVLIEEMKETDEKSGGKSAKHYFKKDADKLAEQYIKPYEQPSLKAVKKVTTEKTEDLVK